MARKPHFQLIASAMQSVVGRRVPVAGSLLASPGKLGLHVGPGRFTQQPTIRCAATMEDVKSLLGKPATKSTGFACLEAKAPLQLHTMELPAELPPTEIDIQVTHNGVCHSDLHMRDDDWGLSKFPFFAGHEVVGIVTAKGAQVSGLEVGQRVGVGWIRCSCRRCGACIKGQENLCAQGYTGLIVNGNNGGFQSVLRAPADFSYTLPDELASEHAAPLLCAGVTVYAPLKRYITRPAMKVAILGVGGLGHLGVQYAAALGSVVTAIDNDLSKKEEAKTLGADEFMHWNDENLASHTGAFDVILNCVSANLDTGKLLAMLRNDGTLVQLGIPGGATMTLPLQDVVFGQKKVAGSIVGGRADMHEMLDFSAAKGIKPMIELMPMHKVNEALARMHSGKAKYRVVLTMDNCEPALTNGAS
ncbi:chaperonin 10-like protein [Haematococcus lacustris]